MRKFLLSVAIAASTMTLAGPATAQPAQRAHYSQHNYGQIRSLQARIDNIERQIVRLDQRRILSNREGRELRAEARAVEQRLRVLARSGLTRAERSNIEQRIARLERHVRREAADRNRR